MRKQVLFMMLAAITMLNGTRAFASNVKNDGDPIIVIGESSKDTGTNHRTFLPLECWYSKSAQVFIVDVLYPMSDIQMTVESVDESLSQTIQLSGMTGSQIVPMSVGTGDYVVSFMLPSEDIILVN